eukprot:Awhi_evm1s2107
MFINGNWVSRSTSCSFYDLKNENECGTPANKQYFELPKHNLSCNLCHRLRSYSAQPFGSGSFDENNNRGLYSYSEEKMHMGDGNQNCNMVIKKHKANNLSKFCQRLVQ